MALQLSGQADTPCFAYEGSGSLSGRGSINVEATGSFKIGGGLRFKGYGTFVCTMAATPVAVTPLSIAGRTLPHKQKLNLVRAYDHEAVMNGWWDPANAAYIPVGTATNYKVVNRRKAPSGTEPHYGLIISES